MGLLDERGRQADCVQSVPVIVCFSVKQLERSAELNHAGTLLTMQPLEGLDVLANGILMLGAKLSLESSHETHQAVRVAEEVLRK